MSEQASTYVTSRIEEADPREGFRCGKHPLDDYFKRHAQAKALFTLADSAPRKPRGAHAW